MSRIKDYVCAGCGNYNINPESQICERCKRDLGTNPHFYDVCIGADTNNNFNQGSSNHGKQQASSNQKKHKAKQRKAK